MIKNIIFDFGDIFINLDKEVVFREMKKRGAGQLTSKLQEVNDHFEIGKISSQEFVQKLTDAYPGATPNEIVAIWNAMLLDFPDYRLEFIEKLADEDQYRLFLLSNTNALHIPHVAKKMGFEKFERFKNSFEGFYLSHELQMRKPNADIFEFVLHENNLNAQETLFIDDSKINTDAAEKLGIRCWNLLVGKEDIVDLKSKL